MIYPTNFKDYSLNHRQDLGELSHAAENSILEQISVFAIQEKNSGVLTVLCINKMPETITQIPLMFRDNQELLSAKRIEEDKAQKALQTAMLPYSLNLLRLPSLVLNARAIVHNASVVPFGVMGTNLHTGKEQ